MANYDAFRRVVEHEANQDDDGGFFAKLYGLEPDREPRATYAAKNRYLRDDVEAILRAHRYPDEVADAVMETLIEWELNKDND